VALKTAVRDGVKLSYLETGSGDPPLVFIHGLWCNHTFWREQIPVFARQHRVMAVDLRGHGASDKPEQDYTIEGFADDVTWLMGEARLRRPIIVGHSMGGHIALSLSLERPDTVRAVVLVDEVPIPPPEPLAVQMPALKAGLESPAYKEMASAIISTMFPPNSDPALKEETVRAMLGTPQHVMASAFSNHVPSLSHLRTGDLPVPTLLVSASEMRRSVDEVKARYPNLQIACVVGAGHFLQMEVPDQFNAMLRRFVEVCP
jgi:pimeloyl-ACP methyl ester carboxylesterase